MSEIEDYVPCGQNIAQLMPTCDLRWRINPTPGERPTLEQRWEASSSYGGTTFTEERWRPVPTFEEKFS